MHIPLATYRLQFNPDFKFQDARRILAYLAELGISDIYASPIFKSRQGSAHGYDVVDHNQLNPELGEPADFEALLLETKRLNLSWLQDFVPNHMSFSWQNQMLMDVLENGPQSEYYNFFDVIWNHHYENLRGKLLAPFLGKFYGNALEEGEIQLRYAENGLTIHYYDLRFPLALQSYQYILTHNIGVLEKELGVDHPDLMLFQLLGQTFGSIAALTDKQEARTKREQAKKLLWNLYTKNQSIRKLVDGTLIIFNGEKGHATSFNYLDELLDKQFFRLSFWKVAAEEINYRRFFSINDLISLRVEDQAVFDLIHGLVFELLQSGKISGLRIDHIDGLYEPTAYLQALRQKLGPIYLVVEKILDSAESLPASWPVQGTTGYDFINCLNNIYCKKENASEFAKIYYKFTGTRNSYEELVADKKRLIIGKHMAGDIDNLAYFMKRLAGRNRHSLDITLYGLKRALVEVIANLGVYRTYISQESDNKLNFTYIDEAIQRARRYYPGLVYELDFIERFLHLDYNLNLSETEKEQLLHFVRIFQQITGPLMAKGFEDTVLYIYNKLISLNEVGGSPNRFGITLEEFHEFNRKKAALYPATLNATSTHDTKRGEDVRARINVLSEIPREWETHLKKWSRLNQRKKIKLENKSVPERNDEYFLYQTLLGGFPFYESESEEFKIRLKAYIVKAVREAKIHTAWIKPDTEYEEACVAFGEKILAFSENNRFLKEFLPFQKKIAHYGCLNSLSQTLLKITSPGLPDFYQGSELWDLNLVDPDNRRPVDFAKRMALLRDIREKSVLPLQLLAELLASPQDGRVKLFLIRQALQARRKYPDVFEMGSYQPLPITGKYKEHLIAFSRSYALRTIIVVAPRFCVNLVPEGEFPCGETVWQDTALTPPAPLPQSWQNLITQQPLATAPTLLAGDVLRHFPLALLEAVF